MTAARRGQKEAFSATSTVAKLPRGAVRPPLSHTSTIPASAPERATRRAPERQSEASKVSDYSPSSSFEWYSMIVCRRLSATAMP
jgi:hypothetical protein